METTSMNEKFNFDGGIYSLNEVLKTEDFPIVARIAKTNKFVENSLIENKEVLLQRRLKTKFAQVRILDFSDKEKLLEEKGIEFIMEHDNFVDDKYLIPVSYNGKLKLIPRPGGGKRYMTVLQVLQVLPRYVLVAEDTVAIPPNGIGKNIIVPAKTILELVRIFTADRVTYIECSDGRVSYAFSEKDRVNFIEVEDENVYHLFELVRLKLLPKVFHFLDVDPKDIVQRNEELNSGILTIAEGPVELIGFVDLDIIVGWIRDNKKKTYETCIIQSGLWSILQVQKQPFIDHKARRTYIEKKFRHCKNTDFIERSLYVIPADQSEITWLRSPDFFERRSYGSSMFGALHTDFQDSSEDEHEAIGEYISIVDRPPPVPERPKKMNNQLGPTLLLPKVKEKMTVFKWVHKELLNWLSAKSMQIRNGGKKNEPSSNTQPRKKETKAVTLVNKLVNKHRSFSESDVTRVIPPNHFKKPLHGNQPQLCKVDFLSSESNIRATSHYLHPVGSLGRQIKSYENIPQVPPTPQSISSTNHSMSSEIISCSSSDSGDSASNSSHDYDYPNIKVEFPPPDALKHRPEIDSIGFQEDHYNTEPTAQNRNMMKQCVTTSANENSARGDCEYLTKQTSSHPLESEGSGENKILSPRHILDINQSEDNFYRYSTEETAQCFIHCGLKEFADECLKNYLDGSFFKNFDLQILTGDPFHLSAFQVLKVKKIIFEGWRPSIRN